MSPKLYVLYLDDWTGVYIDGELMYQHHAFHEEDVISQLGIECDFVGAYDDYDLMRELSDKGTFSFDEGYPFPETLDEWKEMVKEAHRIKDEEVL